jgi:TPP-dependent 2-oxoacid decarboxylase
MEISSTVRFKLNPIVIVLNNGGDETERRLLDGPFNDLQPWQYRSTPDIVGGGRGSAALQQLRDVFGKRVR